jgi:hypothetical protein
MQFSECERPLQEESQFTRDAWRSSSLAACAGFCGAIPFGLCFWIPILMLSGAPSTFSKLDVGALLWGEIAAIPLIPFLISLAFRQPADLILPENQRSLA